MALVSRNASVLTWSHCLIFCQTEENIFKSVKSKLQNPLEEKMSLVLCHKIVSEFLMKCALSNNYLVAWRYLVACRILY